MSKDLFTLENINKAKVLFSPHSEDDIYLTRLSSAHWCIHQLSTLSEYDIEQALDYLNVWDLIDVPQETARELTKIDSYAWRYCVAEPLSDGNKTIPLVGACAVLGMTENEDIPNDKYLLAASNFAFAILAKQADDAEVVNSFDNLSSLDLIEKRQKAAYAKHDKYYGPIKAKINVWAEQVISEDKGKITMTALTNQVDAKYHDWVTEHPVGSIEYMKLHPFNKNQDADKGISWETIYDWVTPLLRDKKNKPAK